MITRKQWAADEEKQKTLQKLINDPVMQEALQLVKEACTPRAREMDDPTNMTTLYALDYSRATGWFDAISMLLSLQKVDSIPRKDPAKPWKHKETEPKT